VRKAQEGRLNGRQNFFGNYSLGMETIVYRSLTVLISAINHRIGAQSISDLTLNCPKEPNSLWQAEISRKRRFFSHKSVWFQLLSVPCKLINRQEFQLTGIVETVASGK